MQLGRPENSKSRDYLCTEQQLMLWDSLQTNMCNMYTLEEEEGVLEQHSPPGRNMAMPYMQVTDNSSWVRCIVELLNWL